MSSKLRLMLAGLTAAALIGGVMVADPADAGKKKKHKKKAKVVKVHKGKSVKQVSQGGNATAGNGGNGGAGGSSGNVYNTGNVTGGVAVPGPDIGLAADFVACVNGVLAEFGDILVLEMEGCAGPNPPGPAFSAFEDCLPPPQEIIFGLLGWTAAEIVACLDVTVPGPVSTTGGGSVFSGTGGNGGSGGAGGNAIGGTGGNNSNTSSVTVTRDDHSIDVNG